MLRILVRLYLVIATLLTLAILVVVFVFPHIFAELIANSVRRDFGGEAHLISTTFSGRTQTEKNALLQKLNSITPARYSMAPATELASMPAYMHAQLDQYHMAWQTERRRFYVVYVQLDDGTFVRIDAYHEVLWVEVFAYLLVFATILAGILIWLFPHWRDLEKLRLAASQFGKGVLDARAGLSRRSSLYQLSSHFDHMADRIGKLIQAQRDLANAVSHELRTPLSRMEFGLESLQYHAQDQGSIERILALRKDVGELEDLVAELLTLGRLEHERQGVFGDRIELSAFLLESSGVSEESLAVRNVRLVRQVDERLGTILTEAHTLARAYSNLVRNAARYARSQIDVKAEKLDDHSWNLIVEDDGPGIAVAERERVFDPFYRLDPSRDRATGGYGLGLAIVKKIVHRHGGTIRVESAQSGGARFVMHFPLLHE